ncbi:hypothetical protein K4L06_20740 [Lysobacter sp. BMK333-48F3]|uniref:hypothetical protein n=1 Tax=Lysobacter sp. BMK333-48F3 TaxID=2867962 RepID=UPI001C8C9F47|nr:hypothetical protein [Lysobacter sp. BMK333-48F3]MBX9403741.1 hypothetical protein [Lysobacter sp. BMK333-48F3]
MSHYGPEQSYQVGKFGLRLHPYVAAPENVFATGAAVEYGIDGKVSYARAALHSSAVGLIQLVQSPLALFAHAQPGRWSVHKREPEPGASLLGRCLYGEANLFVGEHSPHYAGQPVRRLAATECWLIDTAREVADALAGGVLDSPAATRFAEYALDTGTGKVAGVGITWGYKLAQNPTYLNRFELVVIAPRETRLRDHPEHLDALAEFLDVGRARVESCID